MNYFTLFLYRKQFVQLNLPPSGLEAMLDLSSSGSASNPGFSKSTLLLTGLLNNYYTILLYIACMILWSWVIIIKNIARAGILAPGRMFVQAGGYFVQNDSKMSKIRLIILYSESYTIIGHFCPKPFGLFFYCSFILTQIPAFMFSKAILTLFWKHVFKSNINAVLETCNYNLCVILTDTRISKFV